LDAIGEADNTIIAVVGDHGYGLGELGSWGKYTLLEQGTRALMMIAVPTVPGRAAVKQQHAPGLVEFVDLFPTLADAAGLLLPAGVDGVSLMPIITGQTQTVKQRAFSQYPAIHRPVGNNATIMGAAMRTSARGTGTAMSASAGTASAPLPPLPASALVVPAPDNIAGGWRIVAWCAYDFTHFRPIFDDCVGYELYSYAGVGPDDVEAFDLVNLAEDPAHAAVKASLLSEMEEHWV
jgi:iduronate 2-sulfatase